MANNVAPGPRHESCTVQRPVSLVTALSSSHFGASDNNMGKLYIANSPCHFLSVLRVVRFLWYSVGILLILIIFESMQLLTATAVSSMLVGVSQALLYPGQSNLNHTCQLRMSPHEKRRNDLIIISRNPLPILLRKCVPKHHRLVLY